MKAIIPLVSIIVLAGCNTMHATSMRVGRLEPAKSEGCKVRFENLTFQEANARFHQVGLVTLSGATEKQPQAWMGETKEKLWPKVCEIGGNIVTPNAMAGAGTYMGIGTGTIQFAVWKDRKI